MAMEKHTSYGMLRKACEEKGELAEKILGYIETELVHYPFSFGIFDFGEADSETCYMAGLCDGLVIVLNDDIFNDSITIMSTLMSTFWDEQ